MHRFTPALVFALLTLAVISPAAASAADPVLNAEEKSFCTQINQYRAQNGRPALRLSVSLTNASRWMSNDLATVNYFSHTDSLGRTFVPRLAAFGYAFNTYKAENIAAGYASGASTFAQWKASAGHNTNMLNPNYTVIGIGRAYSASSTYGYYWTTDFGGYADRTIPC
jgi:uncharacterized protein YkwD